MQPSNTIRLLAENAKQASYGLLEATTETKNDALKNMKMCLMENKNKIMEANLLDKSNTEIDQQLKNRLDLSSKL